MKRTSLFILPLLAFGAALLPVPPVQYFVLAQSVASLQSSLKGKEKKLRELVNEESKVKASQRANRAAQKKAKDDDDTDKEKTLKSEGDRIGSELNSLAKKIAAKRDEIADTYAKIRKAARSQLEKEISSQNFKSAKGTLASWSAAFAVYKLEKHVEESLRKRPDTDSRSRAKREKSRLERLIGLHSKESTLLADEEKALTALAAKNFNDGAWKGIKSSLSSLLAKVKSRGETLRSELKSEKERMKTLNAHLK